VNPSQYKVSQVLELVRLRADAPPQLWFWLKHASAGASWLEAPRPDWLLYLARVVGLSSQILSHLEEVAKVAHATVRRSGKAADNGHSDGLDYGLTPLLDGAQLIRDEILKGK
jgi:hypothetical protein